MLMVFNVLVILSNLFLFQHDGKEVSEKENRENNNEIVSSQVSKILKVPSDFSTIAMAVERAKDGDQIIVAPGKYFESQIEITKSITISSEWKLTGDESKIQETIIDSEDKKLFSIKADGVEISGLKFINGNHTLDISAKIIIKYNHFINNLDAISFESGSGGYAGYNTIEDDRDDGIDIDIGQNSKNIGSDVIIERNTIINSKDDGMEIRLFSHPNQNIRYDIRENVIIGSNNAAIQIISYDVYTGKEFHIHHNIFHDCKIGLGCMEGANTREDMTGASKMDELVLFYNNTMAGNQMGATGGNTIIAVNNLVIDNKLGGFKRFGKNSAIVNNLFYNNGEENFVEINESVDKKKNIFSINPQVDRKTFELMPGSPCIDAGAKKYKSKDKIFLEIHKNYIRGKKPDIGAIEQGREYIIPFEIPKVKKN